MTQVIGYTYEADVHCKDCAKARFGEEPEAALDGEGNRPSAILTTEETRPEGEYCGDCGAVVAPPWFHASDEDLEAFGVDRETYQQLREKHFGKGDGAYD